MTLGRKKQNLKEATIKKSIENLTDAMHTGEGLPDVKLTYQLHYPV